jgi:hypothetical protein
MPDQPTLKFGKLPPRIDPRTLRFSSFLLPTLPPPPPSYDVLANLRLKVKDPTVLFPMDFNDRYGDCVAACLAHAITVYRGLVGQERVMLADAVLRLYFKLTGGQDIGLYVLSTLNYWRSARVAGDQILAYVSIDSLNLTHVRQAIQIFGGLICGFAVQANAVADFWAGRTWTQGTLTNSGHCVFITEFDQSGFTCLTWGAKQKADLSWWNTCVEEVYAVIPYEATMPGYKDGFNFEKLLSDLALVAN